MHRGEAATPRGLLPAPRGPRLWPVCSEHVPTAAAQPGSRRGREGSRGKGSGYRKTMLQVTQDGVPRRATT